MPYEVELANNIVPDAQEVKTVSSDQPKTMVFCSECKFIVQY